jgi:hypothetical protein
LGPDTGRCNRDFWCFSVTPDPRQLTTYFLSTAAIPTDITFEEI